jgi:hypothetical protein
MSGMIPPCLSKKWQISPNFRRNEGNMVQNTTIAAKLSALFVKHGSGIGARRRYAYSD